MPATTAVQTDGNHAVLRARLPLFHQPASYVPPPRLATKRRDWRIKEVAHTFAAGRCERWGRSLGLLVVVSSTIIGTAAFTELKGNPSRPATWAVVGIATFSALAAAVKEFFQFGKTSAGHLAEAIQYKALKDQADDLADGLDAHIIDRASAETKLCDLEKQAKDVDGTPPMVVGRPYRKATAWVERQEWLEMPHGA